MPEYMPGGDRTRRGSERKAKADTVDVQAQAKSLRKRERAGGENAPKNIELAAYLGDPGARELLGSEAPEQGKEVKKMYDLHTWIKSLESFGETTLLLRAPLPAAWSALRISEQWINENFNEEEAADPRQALELVEKYLLDPESVSQEELSTAAEAARAVSDTAHAFWMDEGPDADDSTPSSIGSYAAASIAEAAEVALNTARGDVSEAESAAQAFSLNALRAVNKDRGYFYSPKMTEDGREANRDKIKELQRVIAAELISWAIGMPEDDPVHKRVEARKKEAEQKSKEE